MSETNPRGNRERVTRHDVAASALQWLPVGIRHPVPMARTRTWGLTLILVGIGAAAAGGLVWAGCEAPDPDEVEDGPEAPMLHHAPTSTPAWWNSFDAAVAERNWSAVIALVRERLELNPSDLPAEEQQRLMARLADLLPELPPEQGLDLLSSLDSRMLSAEGRRKLLEWATQGPTTALRTPLIRKVADQDLPTEVLRTLTQDRDPRLRALAAQALSRQAKAQDPQAQAAVAALAQTEPDPRVRKALAGATAPPFAEDSDESIILPSANRRASPGMLEAQWDPANGACQNRSIITIAEDGSATVETTSTDGYHVRYAALAWRDEQGNLIIDGRQQAVEYLGSKPPHGSWIPDSLVIKPDGTTHTIDDQHQERKGDTSVPGPG